MQQQYWNNGQVFEPVPATEGSNYWLNGQPLSIIEASIIVNNLNTKQKRRIVLNPDGLLEMPIWSLTGTGVLLVVAPDGLSAYVIGEQVGSATVTASSVSSDGTPLTQSFDFFVTQPPATTLGGVVGAPEPKQ